MTFLTAKKRSVSFTAVTITMISVIVTLALTLTLTSGVAMAATAEPSYTVLEHEEDFELRLYAPKIIAQTEVTGDYDAASRQGFRVLADYIFGNNTLADSAKSESKNNSSAKISMTAPVLMSPADLNMDNADADTKSTKINMTAPVSMSQNEGKWQVAFVMPEHYTISSIPKPNNPAITLVEVPESRYAVVKFSSLAGEKKVAEKTSELQNWMAKKQLNPLAEPEVARYNPPWTLPFMRRNEIMIRY